jgi:hypothetical protein
METVDRGKCATAVVCRIDQELARCRLSPDEIDDITEIQRMFQRDVYSITAGEFSSLMDIATQLFEELDRRFNAQSVTEPA